MINTLILGIMAVLMLICIVLLIKQIINILPEIKEKYEGKRDVEEV